METTIDHKVKQEVGGIEYVAMFKMALAFFDLLYAYCIVKGVAGPNHTLTRCQMFKLLWEKYKEWKNSIHYPEKFLNKSCFFCHISCINNLLHQNVGKASDCVHPDIVPVVAFIVFLDVELHGAAQAHFKINWKSLKEYEEWLVKFPTNGNLTNIARVFLWYAKRQFNVY